MKLRNSVLALPAEPEYAQRENMQFVLGLISGGSGTVQYRVGPGGSSTNIERATRFVTFEEAFSSRQCLKGSQRIRYFVLEIEPKVKTAKVTLELTPDQIALVEAAIGRKV